MIFAQYIYTVGPHGVANSFTYRVFLIKIHGVRLHSVNDSTRTSNLIRADYRNTTSEQFYPRHVIQHIHKDERWIKTEASGGFN